MRPNDSILLVRRASRVVAINLVVFCVLAGVTEVLLGSWIFGPNLGAMSINKNLYTTRDVSDLYQAEAPIVYRRDQYGLRGDYGTLADIDILAVGGSTTDERYVGEGETWVDVLHARLRAAGYDLSIANAGADGHSTVAHIKAFDEWFAELPAMQPTFVLLYVGINDALVPERGTTSADTMTYASRWRRAHAYYSNNSAFAHAFKVLRGLAIARGGGVTHGAATALPTGDWAVADVPTGLAEAYAARLAAFEDRLATLRQRIHAIGAAPIFVTQTHGYAKLVEARLLEIEDSRAGRNYAVLRLFNQVTLDFCRRYDEPCIDLDGGISLQPTDFYDNFHATPSGSRRIGEFLFGALKPIIIGAPQANRR